MLPGSGPFAHAEDHRFNLQSSEIPGLDQHDWVVDTRPSLMIVADGGAEAEMAAMAGGAGFRVAAAVPLDELTDRLALTVGLDALLLDLRGLDPHGARLTGLLTALLAWPGWCDSRPLLLTDLETLEVVAAMLNLRFDRMLCDPAPSDIGTALCLLAREGPTAACLKDGGRETDAARLEQLSAEVRRLAQTIDRLTGEDREEPPRDLRERTHNYTPPPNLQAKGQNGTTRDEVRALLQARRLRDRFLPADLFADPAWDMMLDLMGARIDGKPVSVSSLCIASAVPSTTALRWIAQLTERGIFERRNDPDDARRVFISLSDAAADDLAGWFSAVRRSGIRLVG